MGKKGKKGKGKGKKKAAGGDDDGGPLNPLQIIAMVKAENQALQRKLADRSEEASRALAARRELQSKVDDLKQDFEGERTATFEITADMTRQYKSMQEELLGKINILENTIVEMKDKLEEQRVSMEELRKEKDQIIAMKEAEIAENKQKMEEMAHEFGDMLKETLDKMSERIEITNTSWEQETGTPIIRKLEEYNLSDGKK